MNKNNSQSLVWEVKEKSIPEEILRFKEYYGIEANSKKDITDYMKEFSKKNKLKTQIPCLSINLKCGCYKEYLTENDIPDDNDQCECGGYFIKYKI